MRKYDREHYTLKSYNDEQYSMRIESGEKSRFPTENVIYNESIEVLYKKAKEEVKKGNRCTIWELKYEFHE